MVVYLFLICLTLFYVLYPFQNGYIIKSSFYLLFLLLSLIVGFRDMIGGYDVYVYGAYFDSLDKGITLKSIFSENQLFEKGFSIYNFLLHEFTRNRYIFFLITSLITYTLFALSSSRYALRILPIFLFFFFCKFFFMSFTYVRQGLAMSTIWLSIPFIEKRKFLPFSLLVILATSFHNSAVIFLLAYILSYRKFSSLQIISMLFCSLILGQLGFLNSILSFWGDVTQAEKIINYGDSEMGSTNIFYIMDILLLTFCILYFRQLFYSDKKISTIVNIALLYSCITLLTIREATLLRFSWYFLIGYFGVFAYSYRFFSYTKFYFVKVLILVYFLATFLRTMIIWDYGDMIPYKTFFSSGQRESFWNMREYDSNYINDKFYK